VKKKKKKREKEREEEVWLCDSRRQTNKQTNKHKGNKR